MTVIGPGKNRYYRRVRSTESPANYLDFNPSAIFTDLFEGNATTANINGGADYQLYVSDMVIPDSDAVGDSTLVGLKLFTYPTEVTLNDGDSIPKYKLWKLNSGIGPGNEGAVTVNKRDITVITALTDIEVPWLYESFSGGAVSVIKSSAQKRYNYGEPYITVDEAHSYQNRTTFPLSKSDLRERYGEFLNDTSEKVIFLEKARVLGSGLVPSGNPWATGLAATTATVIVGGITYATFGIGATAIGFLSSSIGVAQSELVTYNKEWHPSHGRTNIDFDVHFVGIDSILKYGSFTDIDLDVEASVETDSCIFTDILRTGDEDLVDEAGIDLFKAQAVFSSKKVFSEGQTFKMRTKWAASVIPN